MVGVVSQAAEGDGGFFDRMEEYLSVTSRGALSRETRRLPAASAHFDPALCNTSHPLEDLLSRLRRRTQKGQAGRLLFHGPPGGGKTEFALYVAQELGREPVVRRPSDLLSPYVGVAEKNIAAMFRECAGTETVLILDEADALLAGREGAQRSWEVTQAAEFLQGLQSFESVLIACTNRVAAIDPALRRRFHQSVEFGPVRPEQLRSALERFFPGVEWTDREVSRLSAGPAVMASDVATAADVLEGSADPESVLAEIAANARSRDMTRSIGFGTGG
jgi:SpoVK/Ycf46/Vps4 family AAA+-type ATPase